MLNHLSALTSGFSGADLENLANEGAILAAREELDSISKNHFEDALERKIGGIASNSVLDPQLSRRSAIIKASKVVVSWNLELTDPIIRVTLAPRSKQKMGVMQSVKEDINLQTEEELYQRIQVYLSGKIAEEIEFEGNVSSMVSDDLQMAYRISRNMVTNFGMNSAMPNMYLEEDNYKAYR